LFVVSIRYLINARFPNVRLAVTSVVAEWIYWDYYAGMEDLYLELITATTTGEVGSEQFNFFAPGPIGSINNTVSMQLKIPVITVETYRGYPLERRIGDQLDIVEYVLDHYDMI